MGTKSELKGRIKLDLLYVTFCNILCVWSAPNMKNKHVFAASPPESSDSQTSATAGRQSGWRRGVLQRRSPPCAAECCMPAGGSRGWGSRRWRLSSCTLEKERVIDSAPVKTKRWNSLQASRVIYWKHIRVRGIITTALFLSFNLSKQTDNTDKIMLPYCFFIFYMSL